MKPCDICLEETCGGKHDCHCETCSLADSCYRRLYATIRITNKCTQKCAHCCFASSPDSKIMMSVDESKKIANFIKSNNVEEINLMGGEFFCNPDWFDIYSNLISATKRARIVSNSDWANNMGVKVKLASLVSIFGDKIYFSLSKDRWHTNKYVELAAAYLKDIGAKYLIATENETTDASIVPIGRASNRYIGGIYDMFGCYCHNPKNMYSFLIDEDGYIYKCSFGVSVYANVDDYQDGGFAERFKEYNKKFYKIFIPSCHKCVTSFELQARDRMVKTN